MYLYLFFDLAMQTLFFSRKEAPCFFEKRHENGANNNEQEEVTVGKNKIKKSANGKEKEGKSPAAVLILQVSNGPFPFTNNLCTSKHAPLLDLTI